VSVPGPNGTDLGDTPIDTVGSAAFNAAVAAIGQEYGSAKAAAFRSWLTAAVAQDPTITPDEAISAWVTGTALSGGISAAAAVPVSTVEAAAQGAEKSLALTNPLAAIAEFFESLSDGNTWIRVAEVLLGLGLIIAGVAKLASGSAAGRAAVKAGKAAAIL
jgi:hypothetical protein